MMGNAGFLSSTVVASTVLCSTHRLLSSSFLWLVFRILESNPQNSKEPLRGLWVIDIRTITYWPRGASGICFEEAGYGFRVLPPVKSNAVRTTLHDLKLTGHG